MSKGGSLLEGVGRLLAPQTTQGFLDAPLERRARAQAMDQQDALSSLATLVPQLLTGNQAPQTLDLGPGVKGGPMQLDGLQISDRTTGVNPGALSGMGKLEQGASGLLMRAMPEQAAASVLKRLMPEPLSATERYKSVDGIGLVDIGGDTPRTVISQTPKSKFAAGDTRDVQRGGFKITEEYDGTGWKEIARGPAWKPDEGGGASFGAGFRPSATAPGAAEMIPGGSAAAARAETVSKPIYTARQDLDEAETQYNTMSDLAQDTTGSSDIALVYSFFKAADPKSTVREGEFATVGEKMGLPSKVIGQINALQGGKGFLTQDVRDQLVATAGRSIKQRKATYSAAYKDADRQVGELGVNKKAFLPRPVTIADIGAIRKQFPDAQEDTAGRIYVVREGKKMYVEADD